MGGLQCTSTCLPPSVQHGPTQERCLPVGHLPTPAGSPLGSRSGRIFWTTPYSSVSRHVRLHSRLSPRPRTSLCFLKPRGPPMTLPARPALTLGTGISSNGNRSASLTGPRPLHANVSPFKARTAPSPNLPLRKGGAAVRVNID